MFYLFHFLVHSPFLSPLQDSILSNKDDLGNSQPKSSPPLLITYQCRPRASDLAVEVATQPSESCLTPSITSTMDFPKTIADLPSTLRKGTRYT